MAAPVQPDTPNSGNPGGVTFDEMEQQLKAEEARITQPDLAKMTLDGDSVPEGMRGKSAMEVLERVKSLEAALQTSESARQQAMTMAQMAAQRGSEPAKPPEAPPEPPITPEMVAEAMQEDTTKGIQMMMQMQQQALDRATAQFTQRMEPILSGTSSAVEAEAKRKYPDEFEIYGEDIKSLLNALPNKNVMSSPASWDDMIAYVRGKDPLRLFKRMQEKERAGQQNGAYTAQREITGYQSTGSQRPPQAQPSGVVIDDTVKEVCRVMGLSETDYAKWAKVG